MRFPVSLVLLVFVAAGCADHGGDARRGPRPVPSIAPEGGGFEVAGGDFVVDDTLAIHVVFALARPGAPAAQVQYARGVVGADTVRWGEPRVLLPETGRRPHVSLTDRIHLIVGERLHHLSSTDGGRGWHDHGAIIPRDSSWSTSFEVATHGGSVHVASLDRPSLPDQGTGADGRLELRAHAWRKGTASGQLLSVYSMEGGRELATAIASVDSALEITCRATGADGSRGFVRWRSVDDGITWTRSDAGIEPPAEGMETGPEVLARRTVRARMFTLTSRRGEPRVYLEAGPSGDPAN